MSGSGACGNGSNGGPGPCDENLVFPRSLKNRPALSRIGYRIGTYSTIRERLLLDLNKEPNLLGWTHREPDDPGIALLEGTAILGDILTFYQELYANEAFLRTAQWRESVSRLVQLLGYRLSPGQGGTATFAVEIRGDTAITVPAGFPLEVDLEGGAAPAVCETLAPATAYPWLSRFFLHRPLREGHLSTGSRELRLMGDAVEVEEGDRLIVGTAGGGASSIPDQLLEPQVVVVDEVRQLHGHTIVKIEGELRPDTAVAELVCYKLGRTFRHFGHNAPPTVVTLENGDATGSQIQYFRKLKNDTERPYVDPDLAARKLPLDSQVDDFARGGLVVCTYRNARVPPTRVEVVADLRLDYDSGPGVRYSYEGERVQYSYQGQYSDNVEYSSQPQYMFDAQAGMNAYVNEGAEFAVNQEALSKDTLRPAGDIFVGEDRGTQYTVVRTVVGVEGDSYRWGAVSGASTVLTLSKNLYVEGEGLTDIRTVQIHEVVSPLFRARAAPEDDPDASDNELYFRGTAAHAQDLVDRRLMLVPSAGEPFVRTVNDVQTVPDDQTVHEVLTATLPLVGFPGLHKLILSGSVNHADFPQEPEDEDGNVYGNLVDANQGRTEDDVVLGSGDQRQSFQTFPLPSSPLTYLFASDATPPEEPALEVYVDGRAWKRVDSLYGQSPESQVYVVREDDEGTSYVQFGDGARFGSRLPSGIDNVVAVFRTGIGAVGPKKADTRVQAKDRLEGLDGVDLVGTVSGGEEAESVHEARSAAPGRVQTLGRLVGLQDYEVEALAMPGVALARAAWSLDKEGVPTIEVTVLMPHGGEIELAAIRDNLEKSNSERGASRHPLDVVRAEFRDVYLEAEFAIEPGLREEPIRAAIETALGVEDTSVASGSGASGLFSLRNRRLGGDEYVRRVTGLIQNVTGVAWARVEKFEALDPGSESSLPPAPGRDEIVRCGPKEVLRLRKRPEKSPLKLRRVAGNRDAGAGDE